MRLLSAALPDDMKRLQGSVVRSSVHDHGHGAGGALTGDRRHASAGSSQDSARGHAIGRTGNVSNRNRQNTDFDYDEIAAAIIRGLSSSDWKLSKLLGGHVNDTRSFPVSLATRDGLRGEYHIWILFRSSFFSEYATKLAIILVNCITNDDLMDCLHYLAYPTRKLDVITVEESLRSVA